MVLLDRRAEQLTEWQKLGKKAIVCGHTTPWPFMPWDHQEVLQVLANFRGGVIAYLSRHSHLGGIRHIAIAEQLNSSSGRTRSKDAASS